MFFPLLMDYIWTQSPPFPRFFVSFDHASDLFHTFYYEHVCIPELILQAISVFSQKCIVLCVKGIYGYPAGKTVVNASAPYKGITVCVGFYFCAADKNSLIEISHSFFSRPRNWYLRSPRISPASNPENLIPPLLFYHQKKYISK